MPYEGEFAGYKPLARIASSERVQDIVRRCRKITPADRFVDAGELVLELKPSDWLPDLVLSVDGSYQQVPVENGYPMAELAYVTVASVILDVKRQRELDRERPVDPMSARQTEDAGSVDSALPGCNVVVDDEPSPTAAFRRVFFDTIRDLRPLSDGETLLETYEALLGQKPATQPQRCPHDECPVGAHYKPGRGETKCACEARRTWFSTDALRIHEGLNPSGPSGAMFAEAMQVWERIWVVNFLRWVEREPRRFRLLRSLAIVLDGPLAVFGHPAWLSHAIFDELRRINNEAKNVIGQDLLMIGVEKTGAFVDHFEALDTPTAWTKGNPTFEPQTVMLLSNRYIRDHIAFGEKPFGVDTYFGRKFFYKTASGSRIVASLPFLTNEARDLSSVDLAHYPRLTDAMSLLDATFSARFQNAISPLVSAHAEASIPLNLGREVLEELAASLLEKEAGA